jgi:hypothetical protein
MNDCYLLSVICFLKLRDWIINKAEQDLLYIIRSPTEPGSMQTYFLSVFFRKTENRKPSYPPVALEVGGVCGFFFLG